MCHRWVGTTAYLLLFFCFAACALGLPSGRSAQRRAAWIAFASDFVKNVNPSTTRVYPNQRFHKSPRQTQTHAVVATPQLLSSLQCQKKGTCSTPTPKCTSELLLFSPDATVTRNRSTRTKDGTQPRNTNGQHSPEATKWQLFHLP